MPKVQTGVSEQQPDRANSEVTGVLLREFDLVNTRIQLSGALTAAFTDRLEAVKKPLEPLLIAINLAQTIPAMLDGGT